MSQNSILILKRGEELIASIINFCQANKIDSAWFTGLGATDKAKLAIYDLNNKEYIFKEISGPLEITNITGNIGLKDGDIAVHCHATLSDKNMNCLGGHVDNLTVSGTCEIIFRPLEKKLIRNYDSITGLNLIGD
jgi:uncharacterized protein